MQNAKREVQELLKHIPDSASYEDIQYRIYVRQKIAQGEADTGAGRVLTQKEAEKRMEKWLKEEGSGRRLPGPILKRPPTISQKTRPYMPAYS